MDDLFDVFDESKKLPSTTKENTSNSISQKVSQNEEKKRKKVDIASPTASSKAMESVKKAKIIADKTPVEIEPANNIRKIAGTGTLEKNLVSFSVFPDDYVAPTPLPKDYTPAKTYPFTLDPFQQTAVDYIELGESVLVSAHTSAGKTAVAEYAIAKSLRDKQRVIYTSPIKALSNQKYRDLEQEFGDVGLMTGDITINPSATCLIMTTEILRSMLYRGSEVMREVAWIIYDEVHYMRDKERGVVWEESIILLPHKVRFVFLSATIPNSKQFAQWICHIQRQPCHVVYTDYRPTPLQHYVFPAGGDGLHLVVDEHGKFRQDNFDKAMAALQVDPEVEEMKDRNSSKNRKKKKTPSKNVGSDVYRIVKLIMEREYDPVIVFSFSKNNLLVLIQSKTYFKIKVILK